MPVVFEAIRTYRGPAPEIPAYRTCGVTNFERGCDRSRSLNNRQPGANKWPDIGEVGGGDFAPAMDKVIDGCGVDQSSHGDAAIGVNGANASL